MNTKTNWPDRILTALCVVAVGLFGVLLLAGFFGFIPEGFFQ